MTIGLIEQDANVLLEVRNLKMHFPIRRGVRQKLVGVVRAVDNVNLFVRQGETLGLVGESGCGKTTTGRCILRAYTPTAGEILYRQSDGQIVDLAQFSDTQLKPLRREIRMIFQDPVLVPQPAHDAAGDRGRPAEAEHEDDAARRSRSGWRSCCAVSDYVPSICTAIRMHSPAASGSASASRARWR